MRTAVRIAAIPEPYHDLFEREFAYAARLWAVAKSCEQLESRYNRATSGPAWRAVDLVAQAPTTREHAAMKVNHLHLMVPDVPAASA